MREDDVEDDFEDQHVLEHTYLAFAVGAEQYAIPVANVTEIVRMQRVFCVPDVARHVRGVINLRGKVIPLLDVRARFGLDTTAYNDRTVIVVVELTGALTGLIVDAVFDIAEYRPDCITAPRSLVAPSGREHLITGVAQSGERLAFILDLTRLLDAKGIRTKSTDAASESEAGPSGPQE